MVHLDAFDEWQLDIRVMLREPSDRSRGVNQMLEQLGREGREDECSRGEDTVPYPSEEEQEHAEDIREPFSHVRVIPIKYIARGRVTVAKEEVQFTLGNPIQR